MAAARSPQKPRRRTIRRDFETPGGVAYRLRLEPLDDDRVRVLEWRRRLPHWTTYRADPREVGRIYTRAELGLE